ncbi:MAG: hypothetical protein RMM98_15320 [Acidobacteriota bacterium]|nr:hypothetical protein [Blastocatellia bacterium]MDW8240973.1 hypothetical protein [Acidobacteriota bacterium]
MKLMRPRVRLCLVMLLLCSSAAPAHAQSSGSVQAGTFDVPGTREPADRYEVFLSEGRFLVEITIALDPRAEADWVELRDEGFGGDVRARIYRGTAKTVVLNTKLLAVRPNQDRRAFGTFHVTILQQTR